MRPATRRLAPETICPVASSMTDVVSSAPGRNMTSGAIRGASTPTSSPVRGRRNTMAATVKADATGTNTW